MIEYKILEGDSYFLPINIANSKDINIVNSYKYNHNVQTIVDRIASVSANVKLLNNYKFFNKQIRELIYKNVLLYGECFIIPQERVGLNEVKFKILTNQNVSIFYDEEDVFKEISYILYDIKQYRKGEFIHIIKEDVIDSYKKAISPLRAGKNIIQSNISIDEYENYAYKNRGITGILSNQNNSLGGIEPNMREKLQDQFDFDTKGTKYANKIYITRGAVTYTPLAFKPSEMSAIDSNLHKLRSICSIFNVDSSLFNDPANQTYNNKKEATKDFYNNAVLPLVEYINEYINEYLLENNYISDDLKLEIDYDSIDVLSEDAENKAKVYTEKMKAREIYLNTIKTQLELELLNKNDAKKLISEYDEKNEI